jgi:hypothetical protein
MGEFFLSGIGGYLGIKRFLLISASGEVGFKGFVI